MSIQINNSNSKIYKGIRVEILFKVKQFFCSHEWKFWSSTKNGFDNRRKMRTCKKCELEQGRYYIWDGYHFRNDWRKS